MSQVPIELLLITPLRPQSSLFVRPLIWCEWARGGGFCKPEWPGWLDYRCLPCCQLEPTPGRTENRITIANRCERMVNQGGRHGYLMFDRGLYDETMQQSEEFLRALSLVGDLAAASGR